MIATSASGPFLDLERGWTERELRAAPEAPASRDGCAALPSPCPCLRCPHRLRRGIVEVCELDVVAHEGPLSLRRIAYLVGVPRQAVTKTLDRELGRAEVAAIEDGALIKIEAARRGLRGPKNVEGRATSEGDPGPRR